MKNNFFSPPPKQFKSAIRDSPSPNKTDNDGEEVCGRRSPSPDMQYFKGDVKRMPPDAFLRNPKYAANDLQSVFCS